MDITANTSSATNAGARDHSLVAKEYAVIQGPRARALDVETSVSNPLLPTDRKWAIRFTSSGTVTIVLGMKDYGRGWFSGYFASLVAARLGVPFRRIRIYYSGTLPAVLQAPIASATVFSRGGIGPVASAVADIIEQMCDQVVERGRGTHAAMAGGAGCPGKEIDAIHLILGGKIDDALARSDDLLSSLRYRLETQHCAPTKPEHR
jgi:hypothetical protein